MTINISRTRVCLVLCLVAMVIVTGGTSRRRCQICVIHQVVDKLECYVNIGFGQPPCNVYPGVALPNNATPDSTVKIWLRAVYSENICVPIENREITLEVVDSFGRHIDGPELVPAIVKTRRDGFSSEPVSIKLNGHAGVFRVCAKYDDKLVRSFSYSPPLIVLSESL